MSVLEIASIDVIVGKEDEFERTVAEVAPLLAKANGCHRVEVMRSIEKPSRYRLLVTWESVEHHVRFKSTQAIVPIKNMFSSYAAARQDTEHMATVFSSA